MGFFNTQRQLILPVVLLVVGAGCSKVGFRESDPSAIQATSGSKVSEIFTQGYQGNKIDIIFIDDNSASMSAEQAKLGSRIDTFLSTLNDIDWQIGITTTDVSEGKFGLKGDLLTFVGTQSYILTKNTPNYARAFESTIVRNETIDCTVDCPSGDEQALFAAISAFKKEKTTNRGFFRQGADIGLLVLSDEDEMSNGPPQATAPEMVVSAVRGLWGDQKRLYTYGMIIVPGDTSCMSEQGGQGSYGTFVYALSFLTGGMVGSICSEDYAPTLGLLGNNVRKLLEFVNLKSYPEGSSVEITFTPSYSTTWTLDGRRIYFADPPPKGTVIRVDYVVK